MDDFNYRNGELYAEGVAVREIAQTYGTPCYVYSRATLERHWQAFDVAFGSHPHLICYGVKANSNIAVLEVLARLGAGFDIVSGGELERVLVAGGDPSKVVFSGVGKSAGEIRRALQVGIRCFNVESSAELELINRLAGEAGCKAPVSIRVNPDVDAQTHPYISTGLKENKFGIDIDLAPAVYAQANAMEHVAVVGVDCHIGSQLTELSPYRDALQRLMKLIAQLAEAGIELEHIDLGGGLGIRYRDEQPPLPADLAQLLMETLGATNLEIWLEPGRAIAGNAGILVTTVELLKTGTAKNFAVVDAAMNDLLRPALYGAWQEIIPLQEQTAGQATDLYDIVGPICESADFLGKDRTLAIAAGDHLAIRSAGAYSFVMSSNYNTRPRAAEVMVDADQAILVRKRETVEQLFADEHLLP